MEMRILDCTDRNSTYQKVLLLFVFKETFPDKFVVDSSKTKIKY